MAQSEFVAQFGPNNNMYFGTAAPTTGTYKRGDIVWNTQPTAAQPAFWLCTAAGSPGTWKASGNIAS